MSPEQWSIDKIKGAQQLIEWFGRFPEFHDAEILEVSLRRDEESSIRIHTWCLTNKLTTTGEFIRDKNSIVLFTLKNVVEVSLDGFNHQNVLSRISISCVENGYEISISPLFGLGGFIIAENISVGYKPL